MSYLSIVENLFALKVCEVVAVEVESIDGGDWFDNQLVFAAINFHYVQLCDAALFPFFFEKAKVSRFRPDMSSGLR